MTAAIGEQVDRIQWLMQEPNEQIWTRAKMREAHARELTALSRQNLFGRIQWVNAVANTAQYTLDDVVTDVAMVLYNERVLTYATEAQLDRRQSGWERRTREPEYWTMDHQAPQVLRIIPAPLRTGSTVPQFPAVPLPQRAEDNLVILYYEDVAPRADTDNDPFPTLDVFEDVAVWRTVAQLARQERDGQDLALSAVMDELATLWLTHLGGG